jgi:hypothetical protein
VLTIKLAGGVDTIAFQPVNLSRTQAKQRPLVLMMSGLIPSQKTVLLILPAITETQGGTAGLKELQLKGIPPSMGHLFLFI